jgi:ribosomal protein L27
MPINQGRIVIRKHGADGRKRWRVKRIHAGRAYTIYTAATFDGIVDYMRMRRRDW